MGQPSNSETETGYTVLVNGELGIVMGRNASNFLIVRAPEARLGRAVLSHETVVVEHPQPEPTPLES